MPPASPAAMAEQKRKAILQLITHAKKHPDALSQPQIPIPCLHFILN
jgi:hypothetical protein